MPDGGYPNIARTLAPLTAPTYAPGWVGTVLVYEDGVGVIHCQGGVGPPTLGVAQSGTALYLPAFAVAGRYGQWVCPTPAGGTVVTVTDTGEVIVNDTLQPGQVVDLDPISYRVT